ncbi:hypothetical protein [Baekduia sp. Peel2402]|uniref:hypothetical protein n=1 Tax=Baekduia sp. Peel2402 TaxID=3458296 RepID=UPI00403EA1C6
MATGTRIPRRALLAIIGLIAAAAIVGAIVLLGSDDAPSDAGRAAAWLGDGGRLRQRGAV